MESVLTDPPAAISPALAETHIGPHDGRAKRHARTPEHSPKHPAKRPAGRPFNPVSRVGLSERVIERLKQMLASGELRAGSRLPAERELAARLEVNRITLRLALKALSVMGVIQARPGRGTFVAASPAQVLAQTAPFMSLALGESEAELREAKEIIEAAVASGAGRNRALGDILDTLDTLLACQRWRRPTPLSHPRP
jgi:DNA-binding transcriptional regulator YhcF (GntR family)